MLSPWHSSIFNKVIKSGLGDVRFHTWGWIFLNLIFFFLLLLLRSVTVVSSPCISVNQMFSLCPMPV